MTYCHVTYETNRYLDRVDYWTRVEEDYAESDQYQADLQAFDGTEAEYWDSYEYENNVEAYHEDCISFAY